MRRRLLAGILVVAMALQTPGVTYAAQLPETGTPVVESTEETTSAEVGAAEQTEGEQASSEADATKQTTEQEMIQPEVNDAASDTAVTTEGMPEEETDAAVQREADNPENAPMAYRSDLDTPISSITEGQNQPQRTRAAQLESAYTSPYITAPKNQWSYGTCWAFANVTASEASMIKEGLVGTDVDLSEWQLAYYTAHNVTDPLGGTKGDKVTVGNSSLSYLDAGGEQRIATFRLANWLGMVDESVAPYDTVMANPEAVLPDSAAYASDVAHLENAYWISMQDTDVVKSLIKEYGAAATSYYTSNQYYNFNLSQYAEYCPDSSKSANHAVTIVGWDDTYSKEQFGGSEGLKPSSDGAWLCQNSYGAWGNADGYFWISYEDAILSRSNAYFFDYGTADNYDCNYQYDGGAWGLYYPSSFSNGKIKECNVFTAQGDQILKAVGFYTADSQYACTVNIYKNGKDGEPESGELVATIPADQIYAGYHTVPLPQEVYLQNGDRFAVVITQNATNNTSTKVDVDAYYDGGWMTNRTSAEEGQSYVSTGYAWFEISQKDTVEKYSYMNCRIKAFTDCASAVQSVTLPESKELKPGDSVQLPVDVKVWEGQTAPALSWESSEPSVASVDANGVITAVSEGTAIITCKVENIRASCRIVVKQENAGSDSGGTGGDSGNSGDNGGTGSDSGENGGTGENSGDNGAAILQVIGVTLNTDHLTIELGKSASLTAQVQPVQAANRNVTWTSNNPNVVRVSEGRLTPVRVGTATITCVTQEGGYQQTCKVTVVRTYPRGRLLADRRTSAYYRVTRSGITGATVEYVRPARYAVGYVVPDAITLDGITYKVTSVGAYAFRYNRYAQRIVIGNNVTSIGYGAFYGCSRLYAVSLGKNVSSIGVYAFANCISLRGIVIPARVKLIGHRAFYGCKNLNSMVVQTTALNPSRLGFYVFYGTPNRMNIRVPRSRVTYYNWLFKARGVSRYARVFG